MQTCIPDSNCEELLLVSVLSEADGEVSGATVRLDEDCCDYVLVEPPEYGCSKLTNQNGKVAFNIAAGALYECVLTVEREGYPLREHIVSFEEFACNSEIPIEITVR